MKHVEPVVQPVHGMGASTLRNKHQHSPRRAQRWSLAKHRSTERPATAASQAAAHLSHGGSAPHLDPALQTAAPRYRVGARSPTINLLSLCAATFFIVSGGPYGLEEVIVGHGYARSIGLLLLVPLIWSLPVALLVGELSSALPQEGGFYVWVRRALGPFWGFQSAWLAIAASLFDMAIYPTLFVTYLGRAFPILADTHLGRPGWWLGVAMIAACAAWNLRGSRAVGVGSTVLGLLLLSPFLAMMGCAAWALWHGGFAQVVAMMTAPPPPQGGNAWVTGVLLCMWNYMGWDNASTVAEEVQEPQRNYPRAMLLTVVLVAACYVLPVLAASASGLPASRWSTGSWVEVAQRLGGPLLGVMVILGGALCGLGMFNVLVMAYSRLPVALAEDGVLPRVLALRSPRTDAPVLAILGSAVLYAACLGLGLQRLVQIDLMLYGTVLFLECVALVVLRVREPNLKRPFRIPGGLPGVIFCAALPLGILVLAFVSSASEGGLLLGLTPLQLALLVMGGGPVCYLLLGLSRRASQQRALRMASIP